MHSFDRRALRASTVHHFHHSLQVRFQDVDAAGIVFFAKLVEYVHDAYAALLGELGCPLPEVLRARKWAAPLRHVAMDFLSPVRFGDELRVGVVAAHLAETEITLGWQLLRPEATVVAVGQTVHTFVDPGTFQRIAVPADFARLASWG